MLPFQSCFLILQARISTTRRKFPQQELYWPIYVPETADKLKWSDPSWADEKTERVQTFRRLALEEKKNLWLDLERSRPLDLYSLRPSGRCWCWIVLLSESLGLLFIISAHQGPCPVNYNCNLTLTEAFPDQLLFWPNLVTKADRGLKLKLGEIT